MAYEARYVFRTNPGADLDEVMKSMQQCAALWRKHGASEPRLWSIVAGELGNYVLSVQFDSASAFAKSADPLSQDPEYHAWQARNAETGEIDWVRSNHAREVPLK
jgi:hypothetical protein